jgi:hypothetical protein
MRYTIWDTQWYTMIHNDMYNIYIYDYDKLRIMTWHFINISQTSRNLWPGPVFSHPLPFSLQAHETGTDLSLINFRTQVGICQNLSESVRNGPNGANGANASRLRFALSSLAFCRSSWRKKRLSPTTKNRDSTGAHSPPCRIRSAG